jgi:hypothetical protein
MDCSRVSGLPVRLAVLVALATVAPASAASAHALRSAITPPAAAPSEDSAFPIAFSGDVTTLPDGEGYVEARIRPGTRTPCAATERDDPGESVLFRPILSNRVLGAFSISGSFVADTPGDYLICAWVEDEYGESGPPTAAAMSVRRPALRITANAPATATPGAAVAVTVDYAAEVPRYLTVLVVRASNCAASARDLRLMTVDPIVVAPGDTPVSGTGSVTASVRLQRVGTYLVCGFLDEYLFGSSVAQLAVRAATIVVGRPAAAWRSCGAIGGRRRVRDVRARGVSCISARALARRWGRARSAPRRLGAYRCVVRSGRVSCTAGQAQVRFRFGRE